MRAIGLLMLTFLTSAAHGEAPPAATMNPVAIEEWPVPWKGQPRDPYAAAGDEIWFVGQTGHYLGRFTPSSEAFEKRDLPGAPGPHNLIVGDDGIVWYAGNLEGYIGRYDPAADEITKIDMPDPAARDPHTLVFDQRREHIWFTVQHGNFIGRLTLADRSVDLIPVPTPEARPYGIALDAGGTPWIALLGTNKLASVAPDTLELTEHTLPAADARPRRLVITADGRVWFADYARGTLGLYRPAGGGAREWSLPGGGDARPYGMALDAGGRLWVVTTGTEPNWFTGFDTSTEAFVSVTPIPSGGGTVRHMDYHRASGTVWFGTDEQTLGRAAVGGD